MNAIANINIPEIGTLIEEVRELKSIVVKSSGCTTDRKWARVSTLAKMFDQCNSGMFTILQEGVYRGKIQKIGGPKDGKRGTTTLYYVADVEAWMKERGNS